MTPQWSRGYKRFNIKLAVAKAFIALLVTMIAFSGYIVSRLVGLDSTLGSVLMVMGAFFILSYLAVSRLVNKVYENIYLPLASSVDDSGSIEDIAGGGIGIPLLLDDDDEDYEIEPEKLYVIWSLVKTLNTMITGRDADVIVLVGEEGIPLIAYPEKGLAHVLDTTVIGDDEIRTIKSDGKTLIVYIPVDDARRILAMAEDGEKLRIKTHDDIMLLYNLAYQLASQANEDAPEEYKKYIALKSLIKLARDNDAPVKPDEIINMIGDTALEKDTIIQQLRDESVI